MVNAQLCMKYLRKYGYKTTEQGVQKILDTWKQNKANLLDKFRQHPNWDEDSLAIVLKDVELPKMFTRKPLENFRSWVGTTIPKHELNKATEDKSEIYYINKLDDIKAMIRYANRNNKKVEVDGKDVHDLEDEATKEYEDFQERTSELYKVKEDNDKAYFITKEMQSNISKVYNAVSYIASYCTDSNINEEQARKINEYFNVNATEGQKLSRIINKLCTAVGLNEFTEEVTNTNNDGQEITRTVGYQHEFNIMAEATTSRTYKVHVIISLNPIDYWGMSLMHKVASCHSIDCMNLENRSSSYTGQSSGGTTTLMLDKNTIVFYTVIEDYKGNTYYLEDKMNRCMFSISDNGTVMIQHKNYPDDRDGGDSNKAKYYREIMQELVTNLWGHEQNLWTIKKGSGEVRPWYRKHGLHYDDLSCNSGVNVSLLKGHNEEWSTINIGVDESICPVCGRKHDNCSNIMCYSCRNKYYTRDNAILNIFETNEEFDSAEIPSYADFSVPIRTENNTTSTSNDDDRRMVRCANCDELIDADDAIEIDGNYYCDEDCAENDGYHYIEEIDEYRHEDDDIQCDANDDTWHLEEDMYQDDYSGDWYYGDPEVVTEDGSRFFSVDNALDAGYESDRNGYWYPEDDMIFDDINGVYVLKEDCIEASDGTYFVDEEQAINADYRYVESEDTWYPIDECFFDEYLDEECLYDSEDTVHIGDEYYGSEDSARNAGYREINGNWYSRDDVIYDEYTGEYFAKEDAEVITEDGNYFMYETSAIQAGYRETENGWILVEDARETA